MSLEALEKISDVPYVHSFEALTIVNPSYINDIKNAGLLLADQLIESIVSARTHPDFADITGYHLTEEDIQNPRIDREILLSTDKIDDFTGVAFALNEKHLRQSQDSKGPEFSFVANSSTGIYEMQHTNDHVSLTFPWQFNDTVVSAKLTIDANENLHIVGTFRQDGQYFTVPIFPTNEILAYASEVSISIQGLLPLLVKRNTAFA